MPLVDLFTRHPASLGESYTQHMRASLSYAVPLAGASLAAFTHAVFPFLFPATASTTVKRLHARMTRRFVPGPSDGAHGSNRIRSPMPSSARQELIYEI